MAHTRFLALFTLLWVFFLPELAQSQVYKISGRIVDSETLEPLPYAHVFIDQTTIGAVSDFNGEYTIENLSNGDYTLVYSFVGYELYYKQISLNGKDVRSSVRLIPQKSELQNVEVKGTRDKEWESRLREFNRIFFGDNPLAESCKILNPWVLEFDYDNKSKKFKATASAPLEIENRALGYNIICNLLGFSSDKQSYKIKGLYRFSEINALDAKEATRWTRNRREAYQNSLRFLIKSIMESHASENGFGLYLDNRPAVYNSRSGLFSQELELKHISKLDINERLRPTGNPGFYQLQLEKRIEVHHTTQFAQSKVYRDVPYPVSWIEVDGGFLIIQDNGHIVNNDKLVTSGHLSSNRVTTMLPLDYTPGSFVVVNYLTKRNMIKRLQERVYLQPDKFVYYPGEQIWFKAHMNYVNQSVRDSLSKVLYVDLIDESLRLIQTKLVELDSLGGRGSIFIPEQRKPGRYFLRAYTNWMRNYGPSILDVTSLVIAGTNKKLRTNNIKEHLELNDFISEVFMQDEDSVKIRIALDSTSNSANFDGANCAVSISPVDGVLNRETSIKSSFVFESDLPAGVLPDIIYPIEYGFSISGKVQHEKKQFVQSQITAIRGSMDSLYQLRTDKRGNFVIGELTFHDSVAFSFQARNRKGKIFAKTILLPRQSPVIHLEQTNNKLNLDTIPLQSPIQLIQTRSDTVSRSTPEDVTEATKNRLSPYADYVLTEKDLEQMPESQSIITALQGRVPGLQLDFTNRSMTFRNRNVNGNSSSIEPLLLIDGVPMFNQQSTELPDNETLANRQSQDKASADAPKVNPDGQTLNEGTNLTNNSVQSVSSTNEGSIIEMLSHMAVSNVSRVEVTTRMDSRYGLLGANGVIAVFTKKTQSKHRDVKPFDIFQVEGYASPQPFARSVNYAGNPATEYSPTWYWNPDIQISAKRFTEIKFSALPRGVVFRVTILGVTNTGKPVSGSFLLNGGSAKPLSASLDQRQK